ncbi:MAG: hypothetical protein ACI814_004388, partial [Mariniblastus sp.]
GSAALLVIVLMVPLLGLLAFSIDYGFLLFVQTDLQRTADQAALAAVRELTPDQYGNQDLAKVRATVREYVQLNLGDDFVVQDSDIEIGRYDSPKIYDELVILNTGIFDTVRISLRRDEEANHSVVLYFAKLIDHDAAGVSVQAAAVLQRARYIGPGADVFPFAIEQKAWNVLGQGETLAIYGDGRIEDEFGQQIPGNWGTVDIGSASNSASSLSNQILSGLTQDDLDSLYNQNRISTTEYIDSGLVIKLNGDTGLSAGLKFAVRDVETQMRIAPVYREMIGQGGNLEFEIIEWVAIEVVNSSWHGSQNSSIEVRKSYIYDQNLFPVNDLSDLTETIGGAYTVAVLVE